MSIAFYFNPIFLEHVDLHSKVHPESPNRLQSILNYLEHSDIKDELVNYEPKRYDSFYIKKTHSERYFQEIYERLSKEKSGLIDIDTFFSSKSLRASLVAANCGIEAYRNSLESNIKRSFCCIRPPGHHAKSDTPMGFCLFNNVAITANYLKFKGVERIAIIDFDLHHGNGTQDLFYEDPDTLFISFHQKGIYPNDGFVYQHGMKTGEGFNLNFPLEKGSGADVFFDLIEKCHPILERFNPDVLLFSAGFDAHKNDSIGELSLESKDYFTLTKMIIDALPNPTIPIISHLEGGYELAALAESVYFHLKALIES